MAEAHIHLCPLGTLSTEVAGSGSMKPGNGALMRMAAGFAGTPLDDSTRTIRSRCPANWLVPSGTVFGNFGSRDSFDGGTSSGPDI